MDKVDWIKILTRRITPQILSIVTSPKYYFFSALETGFKNQLYVPTGRKHEFYFSGEEWSKFEEVVVRRIRENPNFLFGHANNCFKICNEIIALTKRICASDLSEKSNRQLKNLYSQYIDKFEEYYLFLWTPHIIENFLEDSVKVKLKKQLEKEGKIESFDEYLNIIFTKTKLNEAETEEIELLEISKKFNLLGSKDDSEIDKLIDEHTEKWAWLPFYSFDMEPWSRKYFAGRVMKFKNPEDELLKRQEGTKRNIKNLTKVKRDLQANRELLTLIDVAQDYLFLRTDRTDTLRKILYNMRSFLQEVAKRAKLSYDQIIFLTPNEILSFLDMGNLLPIDEIESRQEEFLIITKREEEIKVVSGKRNVAEIIQQELGERVMEKKLVVKGVGVYPGVVSGRAKIIDSVEEGDRMERGDILVTTMTTPEMVEIYHKATAIVTDEGGVTCHAAIISRELNIPAVIATGEATSIFRDGMMITVDSNKGLVFKVENSGGKD